MYQLITEMPFYTACWRFAEFAIRRNTEDLKRELVIEPLDAVNEVYAQRASTISEAKKIIYSYVMTEVRRTYAVKEYGVETWDIEILHEKQCKKCQRVLPENEFYYRVDYVTGFPSRLNKCKKCVVEEKLSDEYRAKKRARENNPRYKAKARERYLRYKARHSKN